MSPRKKRSRVSNEQNRIRETFLEKKSKHDHNGSDVLPLDFSTPRAVFESLIRPITFDNFFSVYWEKKPLLLNRSDSVSEFAKYGKKLFSKAIFEQILTIDNLQFATDVNVVKFISAEKRRENLNGKGRVSLAKFHRLFNQSKGTMQIHQPQRFQDELWRILESLESFFGCLVGANVYITPPGSQGLPPHHDDVEVFILQLEGQKHWRLYKPLVELPQEYSGDLSENEIGSPMMDFILKPGDLLYFPRGTIHQADTVLNEYDGYSTHITISTYQCHTWSDYLLSVFPSLLENAIAEDVSFRKGLPTNFLGSSNPYQSMKPNSVIEHLLRKIKYEKYIPPCSMVEDFMKNRLPPYGMNSSELQEELLNGRPPTLSSKIQLAFADHICYLVKKDFCMDDSDEESVETDDEVSDNCDKNGLNQISENEGSKQMLFVYSSLFNERKTHMMGSGKGIKFEHGCQALKFPPSYVQGLNFLKANSDRGITASEIPLDSSGDIECLIRGLWSSHLLEVQSSKS